MAQVKNVHLDVLDNKVKVTGRLEFGQNEVGQKYSIKIFLFGDDTGEGTMNLGPLYTFKFGERETPTIGSGPQLYSLSKSVTAAPTVNIDETDRLDHSKLDEDPGTHLERVGGVQVPALNQDEVYAVIKLFKRTDLNTAIATARSETVVGIFV
jgi:hypothetical protein